jgi:hypothetical protein
MPSHHRGLIFSYPFLGRILSLSLIRPNPIMCFCPTCLFEKSNPSWKDPPANNLENTFCSARYNLGMPSLFRHVPEFLQSPVHGTCYDCCNSHTSAPPPIDHRMRHTMCIRSCLIFHISSSKICHRAVWYISAYIPEDGDLNIKTQNLRRYVCFTYNQKNIFYTVLLWKCKWVIIYVKALANAPLW